VAKPQKIGARASRAARLRRGSPIFCGFASLFKKSDLSNLNFYRYFSGLFSPGIWHFQLKISIENSFFS